MGIFVNTTSKQTAKLKHLVKRTVARLPGARRPRLGRRSFDRKDIRELLLKGHLDLALDRLEQVIQEDNMLEALNVIELYCNILIEQAAQLEKPKECSELIKEAAAGLMFASARCGDLPELLDARAILADKFGRDFAGAAKEGAHGVVDPTLVRKLSGERASLEQKRRLAKEIAAENDIFLEFPASPVDIHRDSRTTSRINSRSAREQTKNAPGRTFVEESAVKTDRREAKPNSADGEVNPRLAQLSLDEKVLRESKMYPDARMAAEAAFASAKFAAMAVSRSESHGKGSRGGGFNKLPSVQTETTAATAPPSWRPHKSPSPSWKGKEVVFDQSDGELEDEVAEDLVRPPSQRRPYRRAASKVGTGVGPRRGDAGSTGGAPRNNTPRHARPQHRRHATEFAAGNAHAHQRGQYVAPTNRRTSTASTGRDSDSSAYE